MDQRIELETHDLRAACEGLAELVVDAQTTEAEATDAIRALAQLNGSTVGVVRFSGRTPWERHEGDELLHILEGEVFVEILGEGAITSGLARAGEVVVVPRGCWHRQHARMRTTLLFVTDGTDVSTAEDPRRDSAR